MHSPDNADVGAKEGADHTTKFARLSEKMRSAFEIDPAEGLHRIAQIQASPEDGPMLQSLLVPPYADMTGPSVTGALLEFFAQHVL